MLITSLDMPTLKSDFWIQSTIHYSFSLDKSHHWPEFYFSHL